MWAYTREGAHAVEEEAFKRIKLGQLQSHGFKVFSVRGVVAHGHGKGTVQRLLINFSLRADSRPVWVQQRLHAAKAAVEICAQCNVFALTGEGQLSKQVFFKAGVLDPQLGVVICHAHITAGMKSHIIHATLQKALGQGFSIKLGAYTRVIG